MSELTHLSRGCSASEATRSWPEFSIRACDGVPTLHHGDRPTFGWGAERPIVGNHREVFQSLYRAGLRQFHVDATCSEDIYHPELRFWHGPDRYDGSFQDAYFRHIIDGSPDAYLQLRLYVGAPDWWLDSHPSELQVYHDGARTRALQRAGERRLPSLASQKWRSDLAEAAVAYVEWLESSGWNRRVSALFLGYGITWEWGLLGSDGFLDYSKPAVDYFRSWLEKKYSSDAALREAWRRDVTLATAEVPEANRRVRGGGPMGVRIEESERDVIDHQQCLSDMNGDVLLGVARAVKQASQNRVLVGAFYGYTLTAREQTAFSGLYGAGGLVGGHHALGRVLRSPDVDFLASPFSYANRDLGSGLLIEHVPLASLHVHGKAFFDENDLYPHTNQPEQDDRAKSISVGIARTPRETLLSTRLAFLQAIVRGKHQWFTELTGWVGPFQENFTDPEQLQEISRLNRMADSLLTKNRRSVTEVAFVIDEKSVAHLTLDNTWFRQEIYQGCVTWGHTGAPFDVLLLEDLPSAGERYRLVVPLAVLEQNAKTMWQEWRIQHPAVTVMDGACGEFVSDHATLLSNLAGAGVHRFVHEAVTVWANDSMVGLHVAGAGRRTIHFLRGCRGQEVFSGEAFEADGGTLEWDLEENGVALFVLE